MMKKILNVLLFTACLFSTSLYAAESTLSSRDFTHFLNAAYIAEASYKTESEINKVLLAQGYELNVYKQIEGFSVVYVLATNKITRHQLIAVRGTANAENAMVDAAFFLVADKISGINIHQGFLLSARDIYQHVLPEINREYTTDFIGHSLGGATALILAMMFDAQGYDVGEVVTFGQPKVTNVSGSLKFNHLNIKRIVTPKDMVPLVPPVDPFDLLSFSIFWHQGVEVILYKDNQYAVLTGKNSMMRATSFLNEVPGAQHLNSHFMTTYIKQLKPKLNTPVEVKYKNDFKMSDWFGNSAGKN